MTMKDRMDLLAHYGVATVYEALGRVGIVDEEFIQVIPGSRVAGPARTVVCGQGDNLMVHAAIEMIREGDILVLTMPRPEPVALIGELLVTQVKVKKAAGILVDAASRDIDELRELGLPIWTRFIRVRGATKNTAGSIDSPVTIGGTSINANDYVVMDADGVTVVPSSQLDDALSKSAARLEREDKMRSRLEAGEISLDIHGLRDELARLTN